MPNPAHDLARRFFAALSSGDLPDELLTDDMTVWTTTSGVQQEKARYQGGIRLLSALFEGGLTFTVDSLTAEDDRVAAEVRSHGILRGGEPFENRFLFMLRVRDGRIASVAEHFNPIPIREKIHPLLEAEMAGRPRT